jgi:hypothetical protein
VPLYFSPKRKCLQVRYHIAELDNLVQRRLGSAVRVGHNRSFGSGRHMASLSAASQLAVYTANDLLHYPR